MAQNKVGKQTWQFAARPVIVSWGTAVGPMEGQGPLRDQFDMILDSNLFKGDKSWEESEQRLMQHSMELALEKAGMKAQDLDLYLAGDLLNQIITANFSARFFGAPFFGLYGACSTLVEGLAIGASVLNAGYVDNVGVSASSHYGTAERQLRYPTELGVQRLPTAQWTVTGAGSYIINMSGRGVGIVCATVGKVKDLGISNAGDMGTAMAPAAYDTITVNLQELQRKTSDYDFIVTGDLGELGLNALKELLASEGHSTNNVCDCGMLIYEPAQDTHAGGSGCGCSAAVLGYLLRQMLDKKFQRVLFVGTGALMSPTSTMQGNSIPCVAHAVVLESS